MKSRVARLWDWWRANCLPVGIVLVIPAWFWQDIQIDRSMDAMSFEIRVLGNSVRRNGGEISDQLNGLWGQLQRDGCALTAVE